ncbi:hypothetical protein C6990_00075 [Nitrosopumilus sp. b3]|nr:hypothetical protein C6990_00075 [Nitrosopumilus sp. b3]
MKTVRDLSIKEKKLLTKLIFVRTQTTSGLNSLSFHQEYKTLCFCCLKTKKISNEFSCLRELDQHLFDFHKDLSLENQIENAIIVREICNYLTKKRGDFK